MRISVIIPAFNEEKSIPYVLNDIPNFVNQVIVCDNSSTDKTSEIAKSFGAKVVYENKVWEVDEFHEKNKGLWIAEIELKHENESFKKPEWLLEEVTYDCRYINANLSKNPFSQW